MKKVMKIIGVVAIMLATTIGMANEPKLETDGSSKSFVFVWDVQHEETSIKLVDLNDNIIYYDYLIDVDVYAKKFDLTSLAEGDYLLKVKNDLKQVVYSISVKRNYVEVTAKKENVKPFFRKDDRIVYLNLLNVDKEEVKVTVLDSNNRVLFAETFANDLLVEKTFNFNNALADNYTIVVKDGDDTFYENIEIE